MGSLKEKITFILTAGLYLLCHLRLGAQPIDTVTGTFYQLLLTAPYAVGFSYIIIVIFKKFSGADKIPIDRYFRIFFTIGILFAIFFALYEYAGGGKEPEDLELNLPFLSDFLQDGSPKEK
jgi:hypothetical protein